MNLLNRFQKRLDAVPDSLVPDPAEPAVSEIQT